MRDRVENNPAITGTTGWLFHFWSKLWTGILNLHSPLYMLIKNSSGYQKVSQKEAKYNLWYLLSWYTCVYSPQMHRVQNSVQTLMSRARRQHLSAVPHCIRTKLKAHFPGWFSWTAGKDLWDSWVPHYFLGVCTHVRKLDNNPRCCSSNNVHFFLKNWVSSIQQGCVTNDPHESNTIQPYLLDDGL